MHGCARHRCLAFILLLANPPANTFRVLLVLRFVYFLGFLFGNHLDGLDD